ncbi:YbhB/YbcL family Raf kinase inhibitor-like protein [Kribbella sp. NPDC004536]|uniref:YbhB/YbcL family Raf kinase inhibitor-like protein n=1 Tax=Kribbella sp. NPDC004536 TaxID=3364106 RepID=UPI0036C63D54
MRRLLLWAAVLMSAAACSGRSGKEPAVTTPADMTVTSTAFREGGTIPRKYTCDGAGTSPPLAWTGTPADAKALAIVVDDPDAPSGTFTHWVVLDLDPKTTALVEGTTPATQARNSAGKPSYYGPCPPSGTHHYRFAVYALSAPTGLPAGAKLDEALKAISEKSVGHGRLTVLYSR